MVLGILGGIGSGKSTVSRLFQEAGAMVFSADPAVHTLLQQPKLRQAIAGRLGRELPAEPEKFRKTLAGIIFTDEALRKEVESLIHPLIEKQIQDFVRKYDGRPGTVLVLDVPLLLESNMAHYCSAFLFVAAPEEERCRRMTRERNWSSEEVYKREHSQLPLEDKRRKCSWIIYNGGTIEQTKKQVEQLYPILTREKCN